jgi:broad specificity phosphatase PhoE
MPVPYSKKIYDAMTDAYGKDGAAAAGLFNVDYESFKQKLNNQAYQQRIYSAMNDAYGENGVAAKGLMKSTPQEFYSKLTTQQPPGQQQPSVNLDQEVSSLRDLNKKSADLQAKQQQEQVNTAIVTKGMTDASSFSTKSDADFAENERATKLNSLASLIGEKPEDVDAVMKATDYIKGVDDLKNLTRLKQENPQQYSRQINALNWQYPLYNAIVAKEGKEKANEIFNNITATQSADKDYLQARQNLKDNALLINTYIDDPKEQKKLKDALAGDAAINYGGAVTNTQQQLDKDDRSKFLNSNQLLGLHFIEDTKPEESKGYDVLNLDKSKLKTYEQKLGWEEKARQLDEIGAGLRLNRVNEHINELSSRANKQGGLSPEDQQQMKDFVAEKASIEDMQEGFNQKYPLSSKYDIDEVAQELGGQKHNFLANMALKAGAATENTVLGIGDMIIKPFLSDENDKAYQLSILGGQRMNEHSIYTREKNRMIQDRTVQVQPELQKQLDDIDNSDPNISDAEKQQMRVDLLTNNRDKWSIQSADNKVNLSGRGLLYGVGGGLAQLAPFVAMSAATGGFGNAGRLQKVLSTFSSAYATGYEESLANKIKNNDPNPYGSAALETAINAAAMVVGDKVEAIKNVFKPTTAIGELINKMTDDEISTILKKAPSTIEKFGKAFAASTVQGAKSAAQMTAATVGGQIVNDMVAGKEFDVKEYGKQFTTGFLQMLPLGYLGMVEQYKRVGEMPKLALLESGSNPDVYKRYIDDAVENNKMDSEKADQIKKNIDRAASVYKSTAFIDKKGEPLSDDAKKELFWNRFKEKAIDEDLAKSQPENIKEKLQSAKERLETERDEIVSKPLVKTTGKVLQVVTDEQTGRRSVQETPKVSQEESKIGEVAVKRHGYTDEDANQSVSGHADTPLNNKGVEQAKKKGQEFKDDHVTTIVASPIERAQETADIAAKESGATVMTNDNLKTWDVGEFEGKPENSIDEAHYVNNPDEKIPGGESFNDFKDRMVRAYDEIKDYPATTGVIAHSKNIRMWNAMNEAGGEWNEKAKDIYLESGNKDKVQTSNVPRGTPKTIKNSLGHEYANTPRMQGLIKRAEKIRTELPEAPEGTTRLYRGNRPGEEGATTFTDSLEGIALPFKDSYGGDLSYVDVPTDKLAEYKNTVGTAEGEYNVPQEIADKAQPIKETAQVQVSNTENPKEAADILQGSYDRLAEQLKAEGKNPDEDEELQRMKGSIDALKGESETTGIKKTITVSERGRLKLPAIALTKLGNDAEVLSKAKQDVDSGKINPREVAQRVVSTNGIYTPEEAGAMQYYMHQLRSAEDGLRQEVNSHPIDSLERIEAGEKLKQLSDEISVATQANRINSRSWGNLGNIMQIESDQNFNAANLRSIINENYGGEIPKEIQSKLDIALKERDEAIEKLRKAKEQMATNRIKKDADLLVRQTKRKQTKDELKKEREDIFIEIKAAIKKDSNTLNSGIPIPTETLNAIGKLALNYFREGIVTIEGLTDTIYNDLKDVVEGIDKKAIREAISNYKSLRYEARDKAQESLERKSKATWNKVVNDKTVTPPKTNIVFEKSMAYRQAENDLAKAELVLKQLKNKSFESKQNLYQKGLMYLSRYLRLSVLSGTTVLGKLAAASTIGGGLKRLPEQAIGSIYSLAFRDIAKKAPIEGQPNLASELKFYKEFLNPVKFADNAWQILKTGESRLSQRLNLDAHDHIPVIYLPTDLHQIIKDPLKRATFEASFNNGLIHAYENGYDINDPLVINSLENAAFKRAQYEIFQEENGLSRAFNNWKSKLEKGEGKILWVSIPDKNIGATAKFLSDFLIPVSTVPTNIVRRTGSTSPLGLIRGTVKILNAYKKGIANLSEKEAESIMRQLKQGTLGTALWMVGWYGIKNYGGLHTPLNPDKKRKKGLHSNIMLIDGEEVPVPVQHALPLQIIQLAATARRIYDLNSYKKHASNFEAISKAGLGSIGALLSETPILETSEHLYEATQSDYGVEKLAEDAKRRVIPSILPKTTKKKLKHKR